MILLMNRINSFSAWTESLLYCLSQESSLPKLTYSTHFRSW